MIIYIHSGFKSKNGTNETDVNMEGERNMLSSYSPSEMRKKFNYSLRNKTH